MLTCLFPWQGWLCSYIGYFFNKQFQNQHCVCCIDKKHFLQNVPKITLTWRIQKISIVPVGKILVGHIHSTTHAYNQETKQRLRIIVPVCRGTQPLGYQIILILYRRSCIYEMTMTILVFVFAVPVSFQLLSTSSKQGAHRSLSPHVVFRCHNSGRIAELSLPRTALVIHRPYL